MPNAFTEIPAPRVDFLDPRTGKVSREWYLFLLNLYTLTGGGTNSNSLSDLQQAPQNSVTSEEFLAALERISGLEESPSSVPTAPAGENNQVQYNDGGGFGSSSLFTYDVVTNTISFGNITGSVLAMVVQPKPPGASEAGGALTLRTPNAVRADTAGAPVVIRAGNGLGAGVGGSVEFIPGTSPGGNGSHKIKDSSGTTAIEVTDSGAGSLIGFFGSIPRARLASYIKNYSVASRTIPVATFTNLATTAATNVSPYGFATQAQADAIATKVNQLGNDVLILKQLIVSLVDDSSTTLGLGLNAT